MKLFKKKKNIDKKIAVLVLPLTLDDLDSALAFAMQAYFDAGGKPFPKKRHFIIMDAKTPEWEACLKEFHKEIMHFSHCEEHGLKKDK